MATRYTFTPLAAEFPATNNAFLQLVNARPAVAFNDTGSPACMWTAIAPSGLTGALTLNVQYAASAATSGSIVFIGTVEAITPGDILNLSSACSFDSANSATRAVSASANYLDSFTITLTNADSLAAGDYFRVMLRREPDNAADTAASSIQVYAVEMKDAG